ncbi:MAG TPA: glycoside hydrolase family 15 protein [Nocardioides sp.]|uniref:glycoside hydrolase family 15 protein n=1 Tax=Nocardioides sp. TaxID=35761 RepID=UPI002CC98F64|nr:glycoside hydrolase family 15 protein [Nocardioides sp.]HQR26830.1 glycoside hydrolase family 15 protein [Nocardioides sp.]
MTRPIEDYAMIGDLHTLALVARDGTIDWLCLPRFDSEACFASLLHDDDAGHWALRPVDGEATCSREYLGHSLVLRTRWRAQEGEVEVVDFMPPRGEAADVVRLVRGLRGRVPLTTRLSLRFDYGSLRPWLRTGVRPCVAVAGPHAVWVTATVPWQHEDGVLSASFSVAEGEEVSFVMTYRESHLPAPQRADPGTALAQTREFWRDWVSRCTYHGEWADDVRRSLVLLKGLTYAPTGGIVAAGTTSLPEQPGGVRNWDYRYCWLRDATFTLQALLGTGYVAEARAWREWLVRAVAGDPAKLQIMYGLDGTHRLPETELDWLSGYAGSRPVRVGNAAAAQLQLDVWGEVLDGLHLAREAGLRVTHVAWDLQRALLDWLEGHWDQPDNGLWEVRGPRRHFVHSQVMVWAGLDRAVHSVESHGLDGPVDRWRALRAQIHDEVCARGFDPERNTFTQFYGSKGLDAALLLLPQAGFLPWEDPRMAGTLEAVQRELGHEGFLRRYDPDADRGGDGLPGTEGAFLACTFWLADALQGVGRRREARTLFERLLGLRNDVGLLSEEYDPVAGRQLGNTPQAYSLVGLVNVARHLGGGGTGVVPRVGRAVGHDGAHGATARRPSPEGEQ